MSEWSVGQRVRHYLDGDEGVILSLPSGADEWGRVHWDSGGPQNSKPYYWTAADDKSDDSRENFAAGAVRDSQTSKPRYDLLPPVALRRWAEHMAKGAEHYGEHNWCLGIPASRCMASLQRHVEAYRAGDRSEDHLAAVLFNAAAIMFVEGGEFDDMATLPWTLEGGDDE